MEKEIKDKTSEEKQEENRRYSWSSYQCPHCKNSVLTRSDVWRHREKLCCSASYDLEKTNL